MLITISVPEETVRLSYAVVDEDGNIGYDKPVTLGMIVDVEIRKGGRSPAYTAMTWCFYPVFR